MRKPQYSMKPQDVVLLKIIALNNDKALEKLENGRVNPTLYSLMEIAEALEVSLDEVVSFE